MPSLVVQTFPHHRLDDDNVVTTESILNGRFFRQIATLKLPTKQQFIWQKYCEGYVPNHYGDRLAEWSKALVLGTSSRERGFKSHSGHSTKRTLFLPYLVFGCCASVFFLSPILFSRVLFLVGVGFVLPRDS